MALAPGKEGTKALLFKHAGSPVSSTHTSRSALLRTPSRSVGSLSPHRPALLRRHGEGAGKGGAAAAGEAGVAVPHDGDGDGDGRGRRRLLRRLQRRRGRGRLLRARVGAAAGGGVRLFRPPRRRRPRPLPTLRGYGVAAASGALLGAGRRPAGAGARRGPRRPRRPPPELLGRELPRRRRGRGRAAARRRLQFQLHHARAGDDDLRCGCRRCHRHQLHPLRRWRRSLELHFLHRAHAAARRESGGVPAPRGRAPPQLVLLQLQLPRGHGDAGRLAGADPAAALELRLHPVAETRDTRSSGVVAGPGGGGGARPEREQQAAEDGGTSSGSAGGVAVPVRAAEARRPGRRRDAGGHQRAPPDAARAPRPAPRGRVRVRAAGVRGPAGHLRQGRVQLHAPAHPRPRHHHHHKDARLGSGATAAADDDGVG